MSFIINPYHFTAAAGFLFDTYSNALFGYGLMKLKTGQTLCCRVERDSDNEQTDILLYDSGFIDMSSTVSAGGNLSTWIGSNSAEVVKWYDQSGNGYEVVQSTGVGPDLVITGTLQTKNSLAAIKFTTAQKLNRTTTVTELDDGNDISIFSVVAPVHSSDYGAIFCTSAATQSQLGQILDTRTQKRAGWAQSTVDGVSDYSTRIITLNRQLHTMIVDNSGTEIGTWLDGTAGTQDVTWGGTYSNDGIFIGDIATFQGYMNLVIGFGEDKTSERTAIETAINTLAEF